MPFSSKAQMRKFFSLESQGKLKKGTADNWAKETPSIKNLPEHIADKKNGGIIMKKKNKKKDSILSKMKRYSEKNEPVKDTENKKEDSAEGLNEGGEVKGKGTGTSDSNPAKIKRGSFVIPAEIKNKLKRVLSSKKANLNQGGGVPVNLSKGENILVPNDAKKLNKELKRNGIKQGINILAPKAKRKFNMNQFKNK